MKIKTIKLENFKSFKNASIDLTELQSPILITGENCDEAGASSNGAGKTAGMMDAPTWALFGMTPTMEAIEDVVSIGEDRCCADVTFDSQLGDIRVIRERFINGKKSLAVEINGVSINENTDTAVQEKFLKIIGCQLMSKSRFDDFLNTVYLSTNSIKMFISKSMKNTERMQMLSRMLSLDIYELARKIALTKIGTNESDLLVTRNKIIVLEEQLSKLDIAAIEAEIAKLNQEYTELTNIITVEKLEKERQEVSIIKWNEVQTEINKMSSLKLEKSKYYESQLNKLSEQLNKYSDLCGELENLKLKDEKLKLSWKKKHDEYFGNKEPAEYITEYENERDYISKGKDELVIKLGKNSTLLSQLKGQKDKALKCPNCNTNMYLNNNELVIFNLEEISSNLAKLVEENKRILDIKNEVEKRLNDIKMLIQSIRLHEAELIDITVESQNINEQINKINQYEVAISDLKDQLEHTNEAFGIDIHKIDETIERLEHDKALINDVDVVKFNALIKSIEDMTRKSTMISAQVTEKKIALDKQFKQLNSEIKTCKEKEGSIISVIAPYAFWANGFEEIRRNNIDGFLPSLVDTLNFYLNIMNVNLQVNMKTTDMTKGGNVVDKITFEVLRLGNPIKLNNLSSGQKGRIALCSGLALRESLKRRNSMPFNFLLIDEFADGFDKAGFNHLPDLFQAIDDQIFCITHNSGEVCETFDSRINIILKNNESTFEVIN